MKNNIFKTFLLSLLLVVCALFLVACGESENKEKKDDKQDDKKEEVTHSISYYENDNLLTTVTFKEGDKVIPYSYTNGNHNLVGWHNVEGEVAEANLFDFENITCDKDYKLLVEWTSTITFKNEDGSVIETKEVKKGEASVATQNPTKADTATAKYEFAGWSGSLECTGVDYEVTATFEEIKTALTVNFYGKDGKVAKTSEVAKGQTVATPFYVVPDDDYYTYELLGWKTADGSEFDFDSEINENTNLYPITKRTPLPISLKDKVISIMGDSVSTFYKAGDAYCSYYSGYNEFYYPTYCPMDKGANTYWGKLITQNKMVLGVNESLSGSVCYGTGDRVAMSDERVRHLGLNGTPDIIIAFIGINDNASGYSNENFAKAYETMLNKMMKSYPNAYIFVTLHPYSNYHLNQPTNHAKYSEETRVAYNEIMLGLAEKYELGVIDLEATQNLYTWQDILNDNLHPHGTGHTKWYQQFDNDIKAYFNQSKEEYKITYELNAEDVEMPARVHTTYHKGDTYFLPNPRRTGYTFGGWYTVEDFSNTKLTAIKSRSSDITLYAEWLETPPAGKYYIKYFLNGGSFTTEQALYEFASGTKTLPTNVTKEGYRFVGWYSTAGFSSGTNVTSVSANARVYAKWEALG